MTWHRQRESLWMGRTSAGDAWQTDSRPSRPKPAAQANPIPADQVRRLRRDKRNLSVMAISNPVLK
jgi:hypothetical protein